MLSAFDKREEAFENRFVHEQKLNFLAQVRRDLKIGLWAAGLLGKKKDEAEDYAQSLISAEIEGAGVDTLVAKIQHDLEAAKVARSAHQIRREMDRFLVEANREVRAA